MHFRTPKGDRLIQLGRDLVVINQLQPYPRFENWEPSIYSTLEVYRQLVHPQEITKLGVRYINHVVVPDETTGQHGSFPMEDYFTIYPQLPGGIAGIHGPFLVRVEVPRPETGHTLQITFGSSPWKQAAESTLLLDLYDIFEPRRQLGVDEVRKHVRMAHRSIESAFEGSITDRLRNMLEPEGPHEFADNP